MMNESTKRFNYRISKLSHVYFPPRLMERVILIKIWERTTTVTKSKETTAWAQRFSKILQKVSSTVGEVVRIGQWLHSPGGRNFLEECLNIVTEQLGSASKTVRIAQSSACVLFAARKVIFYANNCNFDQAYTNSPQ